MNAMWKMENIVTLCTERQAERLKREAERDVDTMSVIFFAANCQDSMLRSLSVGFLATAAFFAPLPVSSQERAADDLGEMEIKLKDAVQFNWGFPGVLQCAGTPNQVGVGAFLPIAVGENSIFFLDALANANFSDYDGYSSLINTEVAGTTISTSSRLGYRWLTSDRSWMYGINAGYDGREMATGSAGRNVQLDGTEQSADFQQVAVGVEAVSMHNTCHISRVVKPEIESDKGTVLHAS